MRFWLLFSLLGLLSSASAVVAQAPVVETAADGTVILRHGVDDEGLRHGAFERFDEGGELLVREHYVHGVREGAFFERRADDGRTREGRYRRGELDGVVTIKRSRKTVSKQSWRRGELLRLGRLKNPFPRPKAELLAQMREIEQVDMEVVAGEPTAEHALRRLQAYRYLCRVPWREMELNEEWNLDCAAAARIGQLNGGIDHFPKRPAGIDDELWERAARGCRSSNLAAGGGMVGQVDSYMDDSDASNIERIGHRRWCLNPEMKKTGFGAAGRYGAMWSFGRGGRGAKGIDAVLFPPAGHVPVDHFGSHYAWSVALLRGGRPSLPKMRLEVFALDEHYVRAEEPLSLTYLGIAGAKQGSGACIIFRPRIEARAGRAYLVEIAFDGGRKPDVSYVVEFCEPVRSRRR